MKKLLAEVQKETDEYINQGKAMQAVKQRKMANNGASKGTDSAVKDEHLAPINTKKTREDARSAREATNATSIDTKPDEYTNQGKAAKAVKKKKVPTEDTNSGPRKTKFNKKKKRTARKTVNKKDPLVSGDASTSDNNPDDGSDLGSVFL